MAAGNSPSPTKSERVLGVLVSGCHEERCIERVIRRVLQEPSVQQVVVVDDCSTDGTLAAVKRCSDDPRVVIKHHEVNQGKGTAIRTGLDAITAPLVIIQDADMEYDPADYSKLISPIIRGRADVVYGVRGFAGQSAHSYGVVLGNGTVTTATNVLFNCYIQDIQTGFKV